MPLSSRRSSLEPPTRVEFTLAEFIRTIQQHGYDARWSKALICPNNDPYQPDHHRLSCDFCDQTGFLYMDPIEIKVHVSSFSTRQIFMTEGRYNPGTAYFTTLPEHKISFWDKIELLSAEARFTQVMPRGTNPYKTKYPVIELFSALTSENVVIDPATITIDGDGFLVLPAWTGDFVSFSYTYRPVYIIQDLLHQVRDSRITDSGVDVEATFPHQAMGRLDFLVRDESAD